MRVWRPVAYYQHIVLGILFGVYIFFLLPLFCPAASGHGPMGDKFFLKNFFIYRPDIIHYHATTINPPARRDETEPKKRKETQMRKTNGGQS